MTLDRDKKGIIYDWWWTVDKWSLLAVFIIMSIGIMLVATGSPAVAERINVDNGFFIRRQAVFVSMAAIILVFTSLLPPKMIQRGAILGFIVFITLMVIVLFVGDEIKGARRWVTLLGFTLQPSEFMKPCFVIVTALILSGVTARKQYRHFKFSILLYLIVAILLIKQPDIGMTIVVSAVWTGQLLIAGIPWVWIGMIGMVGIIGLIFAYSFLPHVAKRINGFLDLSDSNNYQVQKSLDAFQSGGFLGRGPGEGQVKLHLPDSHTDFIFAVAGEELGALAAVTIIGLYAFIVIRGFKRMQQEHNVFTVYAVSGLLMLFGIQAVVNMGVSLRLLPAKGMTLPFISYGGSSMLAVALTIGMMLSLTRKRYGRITTHTLRKSFQKSP